MGADRTRGPGRRPAVAVAEQHDGTVVEQLPSALYKVRLDGGVVIVAHVADRPDRNFVRVLVGDRVQVSMSAVDRGRGRITRKTGGP